MALIPHSVASLIFLSLRNGPTLIPLEAGYGGVGLDIADPENTGGTSLLGQQGKFILYGFPGIAVHHPFAMEIDLAFFSCGDPEDVFQKLRPTGARPGLQCQGFRPFRQRKRYVAYKLGMYIAGQIPLPPAGLSAGFVRFRRETVLSASRPTISLMISPSV